MRRLNPQSHEILLLVNRYIQENHGRTPHRNNIYFVEKTQYKANYITNIKSDLKKRGYLDSQLDLTEKGKNYIEFFCGHFKVRKATLYVQGAASAGSRDQDSVIVSIDEIDKPSDVTISIPNISDRSDAFAVRVDGESMQEVGILSGDYVIVEKQDSLWWPAQQDIIVTKYLPHQPKRSMESVTYSDYIGPVVKVYVERFGENGCLLGWKRMNEQNPYLLKADALQPIGKVIGVYRDYRTFQGMLSS